MTSLVGHGSDPVLCLTSVRANEGCEGFASMHERCAGGRGASEKAVAEVHGGEDDQRLGLKGAPAERDVVSAEGVTHT